MSLADHEPALRPTGLPCSIGHLLHTLPEREAEILQSWLDNPVATQEWIYLTLRTEGHPVGRQTINRHRRGLCRCER